MKILHIAECAGGVERYLQMLLPRLEKKGIKQYFICSLNYDEGTYSKMVDGVKQMDLMQSFSPLKVIAKVRAIRAHPTNPVEGCADANPKTMLPNDT